MILTKEDASTSDEQVGLFFRVYKIQYRECLGSLSYFFIYKSVFMFCSTHAGKVFIKYW